LRRLFYTNDFLLSAPFAEAEERNFLQSLFDGISSQRSEGGRNRGKRVEIDISQQTLRAYNGNRLYMKTNISSGRAGNTPKGHFKAGPYKSERHFSSLYHNAPMPWSVQVSGNIFIHGSSFVPAYAASKGCVRVPVSGRNPAKKLFKWLDVGTPIHISS